MSPLTEKLPTMNKSQSENFDSKTSRFSFRWFLRRSKSSKSAKEMAAAEKTPVPTIVVSKSCDSEMSNFNKLDRYSTSFLWKLLPTRGKLISETDKSKKDDKGRNFKISFSCNDVHGMCSTSKSTIPSARSSYNIDSSSEYLNGREKSSSQYQQGRCRRNASLDFLKLFSKPEKRGSGSSCEFTPTAHQFVLCKLCLAMIPQQTMFVLEECGCSFCVPCMQQYLLVNIKEGNVTIMCPDADCTIKGKVLVHEIQDLVGDEAFHKFQKYKLNRDVELDPFRTWCPTPGCETICRFYPSETQTGVSVHCLNCKLTFCSSCKLRWHANKTCEELKNIILEEEDFNSDDEDAIIKRCPNCRVPIERDEGCAQMMCKRCKHVFCWHCLSSLDDDFLLRHYDKGPCRNKLGHSRASMVWHRTQVVGIFAGFSFLLLVASPVLLLAAPCLLCCHCKNCKFFYEEATPL